VNDCIRLILLKNSWTTVARAFRGVLDPLTPSRSLNLRRSGRSRFVHKRDHERRIEFFNRIGWSKTFAA